MTITRVKLERFTAFRKLDMKVSPGVNVLIGNNATGKTHLLKVMYAACDVTKTKGNLPEKLVGVFLPHEKRLGRLVHRRKGRSKGALEVYRRDKRIRVSFSNLATTTNSATVTGASGWMSPPIECAYIPVKEMLANAPGFGALHRRREIYFEEVYADIIDRANLPLPKGPLGAARQKLLRHVRKHIRGNVVTKDEEFFLKTKQGTFEFTLVAEGARKLALLERLIRNGTLLRGAVLFWDEPEANLNPSKMGAVIDILLELQRMGVQVFVATHDYFVLKEFDLRARETDEVLFHALYRDPETDEILHHSTSDYLSIHPNAIADTFADIYDRDVGRALGRKARA